MFDWSQDFPAVSILVLHQSFLLPPPPPSLPSDVLSSPKILYLKAKIFYVFNNDLTEKCNEALKNLIATSGIVALASGGTAAVCGSAAVPRSAVTQ